MIYDDRVCCFIDILGFSQHISETIDSEGENVEEKIELISRIIDLINKLPTKSKNGFGESKRITQFSDSIVLSFTINDLDQVFMMLLDFLRITSELAFKGFLIRGGITWGKLIHNDKYLFGPAMIEAYKLESKKAKYPRIVIDKDIYSIGERFSTNDPEYVREVFDSIISVDDDGEFYIDYISKASSEFDEPIHTIIPYVNSLKKIITKCSGNEDQSVISKIDWLKKKLNIYIEALVKSANHTDNFDGDFEVIYEYRNLDKI